MECPLCHKANIKNLGVHKRWSHRKEDEVVLEVAKENTLKLTYEEECQVVSEAVKLGYKSREEMAKALGISYTKGKMLTIEGLSIKEALKKLKIGKEG